MEEKPMEESAKNNSTMYYVLGAVVLVAVIGAGYMLRPKTATPTELPAPQQAVTVPPVAATPTPTPGPITKLACDGQYYNPVIGFPKYFLSVDGGDLPTATSVECTMTVSQENKVVATEKVNSTLTQNAERGGGIFKCSLPSLELKPTIPTKFEVSLKDDLGAKATCSAVFGLPKP